MIGQVESETAKAKTVSIFARAASVLSWILYITGFLACLAALACWAFQFYIWLERATWIPLPMSKFVRIGTVGWNDVDMAIAAMLDINIGYPVMIAGVVLMAISLLRT